MGQANKKYLSCHIRKNNRQLQRQAVVLREQLALIGPVHLGLSGFDPDNERDEVLDEHDHCWDWYDEWQERMSERSLSGADLLDPREFESESFFEDPYLFDNLYDSDENIDCYGGPFAHVPIHEEAPSQTHLN